MCTKWQSLVLILICVVSGMCVSSIGYGIEPGPEKSSESLEILTTQLDDASLVKRQRSRTQLLDAGKRAIPALIKAAMSDRRQRIERAIDILSVFSESEDQELQDAAKAALQKLAKSDKPSTAERASQVRDAKKKPAIKAFPGWDNPNAEFSKSGNRVIIKSMSRTILNGIGTSNLVVQQDGKRIEIEEKPSGEIKLTISGPNESKVINAKNKEDLKTQDPEAFAAFKKAKSGFNPMDRIQRFGGFRKGVGGFKNFQQNDFGNFQKNDFGNLIQIKEILNGFGNVQIDAICQPCSEKSNSQKEGLQRRLEKNTKLKPNPLQNMSRKEKVPVLESVLE